MRLLSDAEPGPAAVTLDVEDAAAVEPGWARYVAGVVAELRPQEGIQGRLRSTLPVGGGLSSSSAPWWPSQLPSASTGPPPSWHNAASERSNASGVPGGMMDQLASVAGVASRALRIDCHNLAVTPVQVPRTSRSWWSTRANHAGSPPRATPSDGGKRARQPTRSGRWPTPVRRRSSSWTTRSCAGRRHVISENARVGAFVEALTEGDFSRAGALMLASHTSLRDDYEVSTAALDRLVERLAATPGVHGARLTGGGFGGHVVALTEPGALTEGRGARLRRGERRDPVSALTSAAEQLGLLLLELLFAEHAPAPEVVELGQLVGLGHAATGGEPRGRAARRCDPRRFS